MHGIVHQRCIEHAVAWLFIVQSLYTSKKEKYTHLAHLFRQSAPSDPSLLVQFSERKRNGNKGDKCEACTSSFEWYSLPSSIDNPCTWWRGGRELMNLACFDCIAELLFDSVHRLARAACIRVDSSSRNEKTRDKRDACIHRITQYE
jgi:hypothetical protein